VGNHEINHTGTVKNALIVISGLPPRLCQKPSLSLFSSLFRFSTPRNIAFSANPGKNSKEIREFIAHSVPAEIKIRAL